MIECLTLEQIPKGPHIGVLLVSTRAELHPLDDREALPHGRRHIPHIRYLAFDNLGEFRQWEAEAVKSGSLHPGSYRASHNGGLIAPLHALSASLELQAVMTP
jgi:hypothetical protein